MSDEVEWQNLSCVNYTGNWYGGINPDKTTLGIKEWSSRVAWVDGRISLDDIAASSSIIIHHQYKITDKSTRNP